MNVDLTIIDNHSVLLPKKCAGFVLDAGARGFRFARELASKGFYVIALEPDALDAHPTDLPSFQREYCALVGVPSGERTRRLVLTPDLEARYINDLPTPAHDGLECLVPALDINELMVKNNVGKWAIVKLNIEGSEYDVLRTWPGPIARQIVVSFHEHTNRRVGDGEIGRIVDHLSRWYRVVRHVKDARYCAGENYWDSVFILKGK